MARSEPSLREQDTEALDWASTGAPEKDPEERRRGIGGSDCSAVMRLKPEHKTPLRLWLEKTGRAPSTVSAYVEECGEWGARNEPAVLQKMAEEIGRPLIGRDEGRKVTRFRPDGARETAVWTPYAWLLIDRLVDPQCSYRRGSIDAYVEGDDLAPVGWCDGKTSSEYRDSEWGDPGTDEFPDEYRAQFAHYDVIVDRLGFPGLPWYVGALIGGNRFRLYRYFPTAAFKADIEHEEAVFWTYVRLDVPPSALPQDDGTLNTMYPRHSDDELAADDELEVLCAAIADARIQQKNAEAAESSLRARVKERMGEAGRLVGQFGSITWRRSKDSLVTDWKNVVGAIRLKVALLEESRSGGKLSMEDIDELVDEHTKTQDGPRVFRFNAAKEKADG